MYRLRLNVHCDGEHPSQGKWGAPRGGPPEACAATPAAPGPGAADRAAEKEPVLAVGPPAPRPRFPWLKRKPDCGILTRARVFPKGRRAESVHVRFERSRARCRPSRLGGAARGRRRLTSLPESRPGRGRPPGASAQAGGCGPVRQGRGPRGAPPRPHGHVLAVRPARRSFGPAPPLRGNCRLGGV